jgi:hypothetical protein
MVNVYGFARHSDFKHAFEDLGRACCPIVAAIGLTGTDTMLIKRRTEEGSTRADFHLSDPRIEAHRRGWMIHPRDVAVRDPGAFKVPFLLPKSPTKT